MYCRSSSGALSLRSNVSIATRTLDTWLGLSEKRQKRRHRPYNDANKNVHCIDLPLENYMNTNKHAIGCRFAFHSFHAIVLTGTIKHFNLCPKTPNNSQIPLASTHLAKGAMVHLVSFGSYYTSQLDASIAVGFLCIKAFNSQSTLLKVSTLHVYFFFFCLRKRDIRHRRM